MVEGKREGQTGPALVLGGIGGGVLGAIAALLLARPAKAAPADEKLEYLLECQTALVESQATIIELLQQLVTQGLPVQVSVSTPWVAKDLEQIFSQAVRQTGTLYSDKMVDFNVGKRLLIKVESSLDQAVIIQPIGNIANTIDLPTNIGPPLPCPANSNISVGLAWDDWHPYVGVEITLAVAPTAGLLNIWAVIQE